MWAAPAFGLTPCANALLLEMTKSCCETGSRSTARGYSGSSRRKPRCRTPSRWRKDVCTSRVLNRPSVSLAE
jgi:hypothetical protein